MCQSEIGVDFVQGIIADMQKDWETHPHTVRTILPGKDEGVLV